jgi:hypothetical protein
VKWSCGTLKVATRKGAVALRSLGCRNGVVACLLMALRRLEGRDKKDPRCSTWANGSWRDGIAGP